METDTNSLTEFQPSAPLTASSFSVLISISILGRLSTGELSELSHSTVRPVWPLPQSLHHWLLREAELDWTHPKTPALIWRLSVPGREREGRGGEGGRERAATILGGATSSYKPASLLLGASPVVLCSVSTDCQEKWKDQTRGEKWECLIFDNSTLFTLLTPLSPARQWMEARAPADQLYNNRPSWTEPISRISAPQTELHYDPTAPCWMLFLSLREREISTHSKHLESPLTCWSVYQATGWLPGYGRPVLLQAR